MNHRNILLRDITYVGEGIAERFQEEGFGAETAMSLLAITGEYLDRVNQVFPGADRQWLLPEVRKAVLDVVVELLPLD